MALHSGPVACLLCFAAFVPATAGQGSPPRMAICFVGHAKAFVDPRVRANVVQNLPVLALSPFAASELGEDDPVLGAVFLTSLFRI